MRPSVLVVVAALLAVASAADAAMPIADVRDARGDVRFTAEDGLADRQRRSVDLRRFTATPTDRGVRLQLRVRRIATGASFDQYFFINYENSRDFGQVQFRAAGMRAWAGIEGGPSPDGFAHCRLSPKVDLRGTRLTVVVRRRCLPVRAAEVSVSAYTTPLGRRGGQVLYSRDRMRVPGTVDLSPAR